MLFFDDIKIKGLYFDYNNKRNSLGFDDSFINTFKTLIRFLIKLSALKLRLVQSPMFCVNE